MFYDAEDSGQADYEGSGVNLVHIIFGPFIKQVSEPRIITSQVTETGWGVQFATAEDECYLPVYQCVKYEWIGSGFNTYFVRQDDLPFEIMSWGSQVEDFVGGPYITVSAFLAGLYKAFEGLRPVEEFFADFHERMPDENITSNQDSPVPYPLKPHIAAAGFCVAHVQSYGRRVNVDIDWRFPGRINTSSAAARLSIVGIEFRPRPDRTLGFGKWMPIREHFIEKVLHDKLLRMVGKTPDAMFEETAKTRILEIFEWTPLALMTARQARRARIEFIRNNPEFGNDAKKLAQALKDVKLYSPETTIYQICKFLPGLVFAAFGNNRTVHIPLRRKYTEVYQLKIELVVTPRVWRRIQVPANFTFWELHSAIQDAMGWEDVHLHQFTCDFNPETRRERRIAIPDDCMGTEYSLAKYGITSFNEFNEKIAAWFTTDRKMICYQYDFGDNWFHWITLEQVLPVLEEINYPRCVAGKRACPPENCGGESGYKWVCRHRKHFNGDETFYPNNFNPSQIVFEEPRKRKKRVLQ